MHPGASYRTGAFRDGDVDTSEALFDAKFWGQYWTVHAALPVLKQSASIVLMSGAASVRPIGAPAYAACNAALEGLARGLAFELSPIRVNCLSPGTTDSDLWRGRPAPQREAAYAHWNGLCLTGRPAHVEEQAQAALLLLDNGNMTGATLFCDGGYSFR
ncbi:SDR family oxidoreductase [Sphingobium scionense]